MQGESEDIFATSQRFSTSMLLPITSPAKLLKSMPVLNAHEAFTRLAVGYVLRFIFLTVSAGAEESVSNVYCLKKRNLFCIGR